MAIPALLSTSKPLSFAKPSYAHLSPPSFTSKFNVFAATQRSKMPPRKFPVVLEASKTTTTFVAAAAGLALSLTLVAPVSATELASSSFQQLTEPANALSLPTWAIHVSSVVEWVTAMALVWQYGEKTDYESWKGLSWGMVPLLGGALCACTWHFFYNSESLEVLVALQAALTVIGNATMCIAAFRIYRSSQERSRNL